MSNTIVPRPATLLVMLAATILFSFEFLRAPETALPPCSGFSRTIRFAYRNGDLKTGGAPRHIADLPDGEGHWTRDIQFSLDGKKIGWPWWYIGGHQDPRHKGKHPELKDKVIVPDVLLQAHNASLEMTFYGGKQFPGEYQGDVFASQHGSWNRSVRTGYEVIRVPLHQSGHASGEYEDFLTGFVLGDGNFWGRPVGVTVAPDGSLLVSDDGSNSVWRVSYIGK